MLSIGWNPFFKNEKRTVEAYICHDYGRDFYDQEMRLIIVGFLRPQANFGSMDELIAEIAADVEFGQKALDETPDMSALRDDPFLAGSGSA